MRYLLATLAVLFVVALPATDASAQTRWGAQVSFADDMDIGIGVRVRRNLEEYMGGLEGIVSFDLFFPGGHTSYWEANGNVTFPLPPGETAGKGDLTPYLGGGLRLAHRVTDPPGPDSTSKTDLGLDLLIGTRFASRGRWTPFAELRLPLGGVEGIAFILAGGVYF